MSQTLNNLLLKVYEKARHIAKDCGLDTELYRKDQSFEPLLNSLYKTLDDIKKYITSIQSIQEQYQKLQKLLQKYEQDIRKHIAVILDIKQLEQQLKLYGDSLYQQLQDSEKSRKSLLSETKKMIADLKRENQKLHQQNKSLLEQLKNRPQQSLRPSTYKKSTSNKKKMNKSIEQLLRPMKTQKIEFGLKKQRSSGNLSKKKKKENTSSLKKKKESDKMLNFLKPSKNNISYNEYYHKKNRIYTLDPDDKKRIGKLLKQSSRLNSSASKAKHYRSQQDNIRTQIKTKNKKIQY